MKRPYTSIQDWMERTGTSQVELSRMSGIRPYDLSRILSRSRRCSLARALVLHYVTGVPVEKLVEWKGVPPRKLFEQAVKKAS
jgi:antitoxin component HigA of HigAB toxin-antitoxin module